MRRLIPLLDWLPGYHRNWLRADLIAGLTAAAVVIPKAMAYATIASLPVQVGLYTAFVPLVIYAVLGTSRPLSTSTTTTIAILAGAQLGLVVPGGDAAALLVASATLALLVGAFLVLASVLRIGFVANYISESVLVGFKAGIGLVIVVDQLPKLMGIHFDKGPLLENLVAIVRHLPEASVITLVLSAVMLAVLLGLKHFVPRAPAPIVAVAIGIAATALFGLHQQGVETAGHIPQGLPAVVLPDLTLLAKLWPGALGIALMSFTETTAAARAFAASGEPRPNANQELLATGISNIGGALLGAMAAGGWHHADSGKPARRRPDPGGAAGNGRRRLAHLAVPRAADQPDAPGDPGCGGDRLFLRFDQTSRVCRYTAYPAHGIRMGPGRVRRCSVRGHPARHHHCHRPIAAEPVVPR